MATKKNKDKKPAASTGAAVFTPTEKKTVKSVTPAKTDARTFDFDGNTYAIAGWVREIKLVRAEVGLVTVTVADVLADAKLQEELVVMGAGYLRIV